MKKKIISVLFAAFLFCVCISAYAHPSMLGSTFDKTTRNGTVYVGSEKIGWMINENAHTNGQSLKYRFTAGFDNNLKKKVESAAALWKSPFKINLDLSGNGLITLDCCMPESFWAIFTHQSDAATGHISSWVISINSYCIDEITPIIIAHEFGHAFGLADLYLSKNADKLMYVYNDGANTSNITSPSRSDIWGAKVITGYHTQHNMAYRYSGNNMGTDRHEHYCKTCGGYKTQICTVGSSGYCPKCKHKNSISINSILQPA